MQKDVWIHRRRPILFKSVPATPLAGANLRTHPSVLPTTTRLSGTGTLLSASLVLALA